MDDVVHRVLQHNPDLEACRYAEKAAQQSANGALAGYFPTVALGTNFSKEPGQKSVKSVTTLSANQLVFSFSGPFQEHQKAKQMVAIEGFEKEARANLLRLEAEKAFLFSWLLQEKQGALTALNSFTEKDFKQKSQKKQLGQTDKIVWLNDVEAYSDRLASVENAQYDQLVALQKLALYMGDSLESSVKLTWKDKKDYLLKSLDTYYQCALSHRPEIEKSSKKIELEKCNIKLAGGMRLPRLSAGASTGLIITPAQNTPGIILGADAEVIPQASLQESVQQTNNFWRLDLSFSWPIFDGMVTHYREQEARAKKAQELCVREQVVLTVKQQVHEKYHELLKLLKQLRTNKVKYLRTNNEFQVAQQKHQLGKIAPVEFELAYVTWQETQFDYLKYKVGIAVAERELLYACGYSETDVTQ